MIGQKEGFTGQRALILPPYIIRECCQQEPLYAGLHITDIGYYPCAKNHRRERHKTVNQHVMIYCIAGKGWFSLRGKRYEVGANQYFVLPAGTTHSYGADDEQPWSIYWVHYAGHLAANYATSEAGAISLPPKVDSRISDRISLFEEIFRVLENGYSRSNLLYSSSVFHYFLGSLCFSGQYRSTSCDRQQQIDIVDAAIHYMKENISKKLSVEEISNYLGYSTSHLSTLFTRRLGCPPISYLNRIRIQRACQLLDETDIKINQLCFKVGITDCYYFSRLFRNEMSMSPSEYKKLKKG